MTWDNLVAGLLASLVVGCVLAAAWDAWSLNRRGRLLHRETSLALVLFWPGLLALLLLGVACRRRTRRFWSDLMKNGDGLG